MGIEGGGDWVGGGVGGRVRTVCARGLRLAAGLAG